MRFVYPAPVARAAPCRRGGDGGPLRRVAEALAPQANHSSAQHGLCLLSYSRTCTRDVVWSVSIHRLSDNESSSPPSSFPKAQLPFCVLCPIRSCESKKTSEK